MYYMSRMRLDPTKRKTMIALADPNLFHGAIEHAFLGESGRTLWRIDALKGKIYLLLVSEQRPMLQHAVEQFGFPQEGNGWETKEYSGFLEKITEGSRWHFRLVAFPTHSVLMGKDTQGKRGKVYPHVTPEYQKKWLLFRSEKHGFSLNEDEFQVVQDRSYFFRKSYGPKHRVSLLSVTFEGILQVTDPGRFRAILTGGIGRGKAYGLGMMTIAGEIQ